MNFEIWKLKVEDFLVDWEQWIVVDPGTKPIEMSQYYWDKLERRERSTIRLCLSDLLLLNIYDEDGVVKIWEKLGSLYQLKSLVNKLFLQNKLFDLRMDENDTVTENMNVDNIMVSQISYVHIKMVEEDKCITLLCSFLDSRDNLIVAIGSVSQATLKFDEMVSYLLS